MKPPPGADWAGRPPDLRRELIEAIVVKVCGTDRSPIRPLYAAIGTTLDGEGTSSSYGPPRAARAQRSG